MTQAPRGARPKDAAGLPRVPVRRILEILRARYPDAGTALAFRNPFELLVATILSAQCTDQRVNLVTPGLFARFPTAEAMAAADEDTVAALISSCGLYRSKARHLVAAARALVAHHGGRVPARADALRALPGVGPKTANVVLSNAFAIPAIAVDTHVFRVARRLGLANGRTPEEVEAQLRRRIPRADWSQAHHWLIWHGRTICHARAPACGDCPLAPYCPSKATGTGVLPAASRRARGAQAARAASRPTAAPTTVAFDPEEG
jgi:endonuclease-3